VKNSAFESAEIAALRAFCHERSFDADWFPGITPGDANRFNVLDASHFEEGAKALLGPARATFVERYKFAIEPSTDDRPYFFRFFRWRTLPEVLALKDRGGLPLLDWGYPVLIATLLQAGVVSAILILLPLAIGMRHANGAAAVFPSRARVALYFGAIGVAFMFMEIAFIQKFVLFLAHPLYAVAVVLCAFLVFAGLGSRFSARLRYVVASRDTCRGGNRRVVACLSRRASSALRGVAGTPGRGSNRDLGRSHRAAGVRHGHPVSDGARAPRAGGGGAYSLGVGRERLRVGRRGGRRDRARDPSGFGAVVMLAVCLYAVAAAVWR
jgi:hypothetical protein